MNKVTQHRGPDDNGVYADKGVTLGNNRLAILDLSNSGHQPMKSADGRFVLAFNGEIYNYRELRNELRHYPFAGTSDTEVLLAGFSVWGTDLFARLNGIFALALWDTKAHELFLVRDRMGVKPLYIHRQGERLLFSSEIKAVLESAEVERVLDTSSFERYIRLGYTPGTDTLIRGISRLPAGSFLHMRQGRVTVRSYWEPVKEPSTMESDTHELLRQTLDAAVARQLVSDRPVGLYLSGGIDSSVILDAMMRVASNVETFSVGFEVPEKEHEKFNADFLIARRTAAHYGTSHHEYLLGARELPLLFEQSVWHMDEPIGNATALAQLALSKYAKKHVSVVLGGDGGDELFGGYERYRLARRIERYQKLVPRFIRESLHTFDRLKKIDTEAGAPQYLLFHAIKDETLRAVAPAYVSMRLAIEVERAITDYGHLPWIDAFMRLDREWWLRDEALLRTDKMTMAAGLEARVPFLDSDVVKVADRISAEDKVRLSRTKVILRDAYANRLPSFVLAQPKRGWFSPGAKWLRAAPFERYVRDVLSPDYNEQTKKLFDWRGIEKMLEEHVQGTRYNLPMLWALITFQAWAHTFKIRI